MITTNKTLEQDTIRERFNKVITTSKKRSIFISKINPSLESYHLEQKTMTLSFLAEDWELNPLGILHGGITSSMFDTSFGTAIRCFLDTTSITTVTLSTTFLKPIQLGDTVLIKVKATSLGHTLVSLTAEAFIKNTGILAATSNATFMLLKKSLSQSLSYNQ